MTQTALPIDLQAVLDDAVAATGAVGAQTAVLHAGVVHTAASGIAHAGTGQPVRVDTVFQIGSTTKLHTALQVMTLVDQGRIDLDRPVVEQLPELRLADPLAQATVTPRHLLSMSSGIDNGPTFVDTGRGACALRRQVALLADIPVQHLPGQGYGYSNASTNLSGRLVEHVTGQTWEQALQELVLDPLDLRETHCFAEEAILAPVAVGHWPGGELTGRWAAPRGCAPAGATLSSTAADLARLAAGFLAGGPVVDPMQVAEVEVPGTLVADHWGLGPYATDWRGGRLWGHTGTNVAGSSAVMWSIEHQLAVATVVNTPPAGYPLARRVQAAVFHEVAGLAPPQHPVAATDLAIDFGRFLGRFEMSEQSVTVVERSGRLCLDDDGEASPLIPLDHRTFLPEDEGVSGGRGWALAFLGHEGAPATHLLNGFFMMRRSKT